MRLAEGQTLAGFSKVAHEEAEEGEVEIVTEAPAEETNA
jgi:hypothetical protein